MNAIEKIIGINEVLKDIFKFVQEVQLNFVKNYGIFNIKVAVLIF